jgi:transcriptional regulator GlxA family with amidase domain
LPVAKALSGSAQAEKRISIAQKYLSGLFKPNDDKLSVIKRVFSDIERRPSICTVAQLAALHTMTVRSLQRLFKEYVGVSPKWTIQWYRLREAARRMESRSRLDLSRLALDMGYSDQAHFGNHFRRIMGRTPKSYPAP